LQEVEEIPLRKVIWERSEDSDAYFEERLSVPLDTFLMFRRG
jgi:hypothetical protein